MIRLLWILATVAAIVVALRSLGGDIADATTVVAYGLACVWVGRDTARHDFTGRQKEIPAARVTRAWKRRRRQLRLSVRQQDRWLGP